MRTLKNSLLLVVAMEEIKIGNKTVKPQRKCPICGKPMVRECVFENNKFVYKERCCNLFCRRYTPYFEWRIK